MKLHNRETDGKIHYNCLNRDINTFYSPYFFNANPLDKYEIFWCIIKNALTEANPPSKITLITIQTNLYKNLTPSPWWDLDCTKAYSKQKKGSEESLLLYEDGRLV